MYQSHRPASLKKLVPILFFCIFAFGSFATMVLQFNFANTSELWMKPPHPLDLPQSWEMGKFSIVSGTCHTACCSHNRRIQVRKCSEFENLEPCRVAYGMGNGVLAFRHSAERSRDCTEFLKEKLISSRRQPVQSHKDRIRACYAADSCLSSNADVFLHICREFAEEEHVLSSRKRKHPRRASGKEFFRTFRRRNTIGSGYKRRCDCNPPRNFRGESRNRSLTR